MDMKDLQDKHKGTIGFVCGSGPSFRHVDFDTINPYVTIAVNSAMLKDQNFDYFVSDDIGAKNWNYYQDHAAKSNCIKLLYRKKLENHAGHFREEEVVFFDHKWWFDPKNKKKNPEGLIMTKEGEKPIVGARTSAGSAVHLAYIMGCDPIVLLGCDCCYERGKRYFWQFPGEKRGFRTTGEAVFSTANRGKRNGKPVDSHCIDFDNYWKEFAEANKGKAEILYATKGGLLQCFPHMSLESIFEAYGDRTK